MDCVKFGGWLVLAPSPLSDPGNVAFVQLCGSSVAQSSLSMVAASMAATLCFAASGVARSSQGPALMSVFSSCSFSMRCSVAMPFLRQKEFSSAIVWVLLVGCFVHCPGWGATKMYLRVGTILEVDCWIDAPVLLS